MSESEEAMLEMEELEFRLLWNSCAVELATLKQFLTDLESRTSRAFIENNDELAKYLRELAAYYRAKIKHASAALDRCISASRKRAGTKAKGG